MFRDGELELFFSMVYKNFNNDFSEEILLKLYDDNRISYDDAVKACNMMRLLNIEDGFYYLGVSWLRTLKTITDKEIDRVKARDNKTDIVCD